jgi:hypothetical protein
VVVAIAEHPELAAAGVAGPGFERAQLGYELVGQLVDARVSVFAHAGIGALIVPV